MQWLTVKTQLVGGRKHVCFSVKCALKNGNFPEIRCTRSDIVVIIHQLIIQIQQFYEIKSRYSWAERSSAQNLAHGQGLSTSRRRVIFRQRSPATKIHVFPTFAPPFLNDYEDESLFFGVSRTIHWSPNMTQRTRISTNSSTYSWLTKPQYTDGMFAT